MTETVAALVARLKRLAIPETNELEDALLEAVTALTRLSKDLNDLKAEVTRLREALGAILANHETVGAGASIFQCTTAEVKAARAALEPGEKP